MLLIESMPKLSQFLLLTDLARSRSTTDLMNRNNDGVLPRFQARRSPIPPIACAVAPRSSQEGVLI